MTGTRNDGGSVLLYFALDSDGQMWRGAATDATELAWTKILGPFPLGA
jgi:hypothetical protein